MKLTWQEAEELAVGRQLVGIPAYLVRRRCSRCSNASARLIYWLKCSDHITDASVSLFLRVPERIQYKIAVRTYIVLRDTAVPRPSS